MNPNLILYLLWIHWVADFVCQSDWMAKNKSKNNGALMLHCLIYGLIFGILTLNPLFGAFMFFFHFPVDYVTSRINSSLWIKGDVHQFFVMIGLDQLIHFAVILYGYQILHHIGVI